MNLNGSKVVTISPVLAKSATGNIKTVEIPQDGSLNFSPNVDSTSTLNVSAIQNHGTANFSLLNMNMFWTRVLSTIDKYYQI